MIPAKDDTALIRREDAIHTVTDRAVKNMAENSLLLAIAIDLRALPGIGTCKDCANWQHTHDDRGKCGDDTTYQTDFWSPVWTKADHSCAAMKPKEAEVNGHIG